MAKLLHSEDHVSVTRYSGMSDEGAWPTMIQIQHFRGYKQITMADAIDQARKLLRALEAEYALLQKEGHYKGREVEDERRMTWRSVNRQITR
tara:strand:- start:150 stop:425 length:276 start_codon:yes stop_codon:yes gene_type:complete